MPLGPIYAGGAIQRDPYSGYRQGLNTLTTALMERGRRQRSSDALQEILAAGQGVASTAAPVPQQAFNTVESAQTGAFGPQMGPDPTRQEQEILPETPFEQETRLFNDRQRVRSTMISRAVEKFTQKDLSEKGLKAAMALIDARVPEMDKPEAARIKAIDNVTGNEVEISEANQGIGTRYTPGVPTKSAKGAEPTKIEKLQTLRAKYAKGTPEYDEAQAAINKEIFIKEKTASLPDIQKIQEYRDTLPEGSEKRLEVESLIDKKTKDADAKTTPSIFNMTGPDGQALSGVKFGSPLHEQLKKEGWSIGGQTSGKEIQDAVKQKVETAKTLQEGGYALTPQQRIDLAKGRPVTVKTAAGDEITIGEVDQDAIQARKLQDKRIATDNVVRLIGRARELITDNASIVGTIGGVQRIADSAASQLRIMYGLATEGKAEVNGKIVSEDRLFDPKNYDLSFVNKLTENAAEGARLKSVVINLAYTIARSREGGRLTDQDVKKAMDSFAARADSPTQLLAALDEVETEAKANLGTTEKYLGATQQPVSNAPLTPDEVKEMEYLRSLRGQ